MALVAVAVAVTVAFAIGSDDAVTRTETAEIRVIGDPLAPFSGGQDPSLGAAVPGLLGSTFSGNRLEVTPDGRPRVYGFFAHWCPHCQQELPRVSTWLNNNEMPGDVEVVAVVTSTEVTADNYPPSAWFDAVAWPARVIVDDASGSAATAFGLSGFPYWVVTNSEGAVVARLSGELTETQFEALITAAANAD